MYGMLGYNMHGYGMHGIGWGLGMGFGWLFGLIVLILVIWAVTRGINAGSHHSHSTPVEKKSALDILKERYARGEINKEEFQEKKHDIA